MKVFGQTLNKTWSVVVLVLLGLVFLPLVFDRPGARLGNAVTAVVVVLILAGVGWGWRKLRKGGK